MHSNRPIDLMAAVQRKEENEIRRRVVSQVSVSIGAANGLLGGGSDGYGDRSLAYEDTSPALHFLYVSFSAPFNWCRSRARL